LNLFLNTFAINNHLLIVSDNSISLNKYISSTGICSRREADRWIENGRVKINENIAIKGNRVTPGDRVTIDDNPLGYTPVPVYLAFHKPPGITCTTDQKDKDNIIDFIGYPERIFPIGRLDKASSGLILLTNDGDAVNPILRSENNHEKEYIVTVDRPINKGFIVKMASGLPILGQITKECQVEQLGKQKFKIILTQGLNRQIRRMCEYLGFKVYTLKRIRISAILLDNLPPGKWRKLSKNEIKLLKES
jgi:23S rRNA pseudouridine2604 synthase